MAYRSLEEISDMKMEERTNASSGRTTIHIEGRNEKLIDVDALEKMAGKENRR